MELRMSTWAMVGDKFGFFAVRSSPEQAERMNTKKSPFHLAVKSLVIFARTLTTSYPASANMDFSLSLNSKPLSMFFLTDTPPAIS